MVGGYWWRAGVHPGPAATTPHRIGCGAGVVARLDVVARRSGAGGKLQAQLSLSLSLSLLAAFRDGSEMAGLGRLGGSRPSTGCPGPGNGPRLGCGLQSAPPLGTTRMCHVIWSDVTAEITALSRRTTRTSRSEFCRLDTSAAT